MPRTYARWDDKNKSKLKREFKKGKTDVELATIFKTTVSAISVIRSSEGLLEVEHIQEFLKKL